MEERRRPSSAALQAGAFLERNRASIAEHMAKGFADWPKFAGDYHADPSGFAERECLALVDYFARWLANGDITYRDLFIGEKAKQFHDPTAPSDEARLQRQRSMLAIAREALIEGQTANVVEEIANAFDDIERILLPDAVRTVNILFVGDCLYLDVISFLVAPLLEDGIRLAPSFVTSHDRSEQLAALTRLADQRFDLIFFSPFTYSFDQRYGDLERIRALASFGKRSTVLEAMADQMDTLVSTLADLFDCPIFVHTAGGVARHDGSVRSRAKLRLTQLMRRRAATLLTRRVRDTVDRRAAQQDRVHLLDEESMMKASGIEAAGRLLYQADLQHPAEFGRIVARHYREIIVAAALLVGRKVVVCDLDNTLWQGVVGEGLGITHYADRQQILIALKKRGVVLAINSKNDPANVTWDDPKAVLCAADFVSSQINWDPKPINIRRIADHLNLKPKDFVFVDDRADERAMVAQEFPGLLALDALSPRSWALLRQWATLLPENPDADRTEFYKQRDARQAYLVTEVENASAARDALYADLGLTLIVREASATDIPRVAELINRTNQFNMTGARTTTKQIEALSLSNRSRILIADASDRFGAMGTIGVLVLSDDGRSVAIEYFVLSCRVFGYSMEFAMLEQARLIAGGRTLTGKWRDTQFNEPCRRVYSDAGFAERGDEWVREPTAGPIPLPAWLSVRAHASDFPVTAVS